MKSIKTQQIVAMKDFFKSKKQSKSLSSPKNWYEDRYQSIVVQRNILTIFIIFSVAAVIISTLAVINITSSKTIVPFVIEVEEKTGITNVIRPLLKEQFPHEVALRRYFILKYLNARESYDPHSFTHNYNTVVRLLSDSAVYKKFRRIISSKGPRNPTTLGKTGSRTVKVKSITLLKSAKKSKGKTVQVRFLTEDTGKRNTKKRHLIATITFIYDDYKLTTYQRSINPLGFKVIGYMVDDEILQN